MAIRIMPVGDKYVAEVTPPDGQWRTPHPLHIEELAAALRNIGCDLSAARDAFDEAALQSYRIWADEMSPQLRAALDGKRDVPRQRPYSEAWLADALFYYDRMLTLWEVLESADAINHAIPTPDEIAWAFLRLKKREWLAIDGDLYGLTAEGRGAIEIIEARGNAPRRVRRLEEWMMANPLPDDD